MMAYRDLEYVEVEGVVGSEVVCPIIDLCSLFCEVEGEVL